MAQVVLDWDLSDQTTLINGSILFSSSYLIFPSLYINNGEDFVCASIYC